MISETFFEAISTHFNHGLPFVVYRKPNDRSVKALLQEDNTLYKTSDFIQSGFVMAPFNAEKASVLIPVAHSECIETSFTSTKVKISSEYRSLLVNETEKLQHINLVEKGIQAIKANQFEKVVLSRCETIPVSQTDPLETFRLLLNAYATAFVYCWYHPTIGLWLGATPETLLKVEGIRFETMSLAGTQSYQGTLDVEWKSKELDEQQIVTDAIINQLSAEVEDIKLSPTITVKAGNLLHLQTKVTGYLDLEKTSLSEILSQLHPTPAVCGFPKNHAKQFILENEQYDREFYTGFLGELNMKYKRSRNTNRRNIENNAYGSVTQVSNLFVNLRCMKIQDSIANIYVGGGITVDSNTEFEWEETIKKTTTILNVF